MQFFVDWKFYTLFSFLFGLGFSVQLMRGEKRGRSSRSTRGGWASCSLTYGARQPMRASGPCER